MVAEPFDDPARRGLLPRIRRVEVSYGAEGAYASGAREGRPAASRALLLAGWLASRLGWELESIAWERAARGFQADFSSGDGRAVAVALLPDQGSNCEGGGLSEVTIYFGRQTGGAGRAGDIEENDTLTVARSPETCVCASRFHLEGREALMKTVEMQQSSEDALLCDELDYSGADEVYLESLRLAADLSLLEGSRALWD
jgi:hypothetical protein